MRRAVMTVIGAGALAVVAAGAVRPAAAGGATARIVAEWRPGHPESALGGDLVVDGYGIGGLGAYELRSTDGTSWFAVCVQADTGHSLAADYVRDPAPTVASAELAYLLDRYLTGPAPAATDDEAAAINALAWWYTSAPRSSGGPVWLDGDVEIRVLGVGRLTAVERRIDELRDEARRQRGPWTLELVGVTAHAAGREVAVRLRGPGGPVAGERVRFTAGDASVGQATDAAGVARWQAAPTARVVVTAEGPGAIVTHAAPGSQRVARAGEPVPLRLEVAPPPTTTTTTTTSTTTTTTAPPTTTTSTVPATTTTLPATTTTSTTAPAPSTTTTTTPVPTTSSTTTTTPSTTSTTTPATTSTPTTTSTPATVPPVPTGPTLPRTGAGGRVVARWGAVLFAVGGGAVLAGTRRRPLERSERV